VQTTSRRASVIVVQPDKDNIAIAVRDIRAGESVDAAGRTLVVADDVPAGHPLAIRVILPGEPIVEYGQPWGISRGLEAGRRITHDRIDDRLPPAHDAACSAVPAVEQIPPDRIPSFDGFRRSDGRVGTRNYVVVCPTSMCSVHHATRIAAIAEQDLLATGRYPHVDGVVALPHDKGCGCSDGENITVLIRTLLHTIDHPNVSAALVIDLGCEKTNLDVMRPFLQKLQGSMALPIETISVQQAGGTQAAIRRGFEVMPRLLEQAARHRRTRCPAGDIVLGSECGGSDAFSGLSANPALGHCADLLVRCGGAVVLSEVPEICGAEQLLTCRCRTPDVARRVMDLSEWFKRLAARVGQTPNENPSPGNKSGGLMNIFQKSLGAVIKAGSTAVEDVLEYAEKVRTRGLTLMQSPGNDPESMGGIVAGGVTVCGFTTGRGTTIGNPICPTIKIATNTPMYERMADDMDVNAGTILEGTASVEEVGRRIFDLMLAVANGQKTASERLGHREFGIWGCDRISL
jgi:altronate hydrolase